MRQIISKFNFDQLACNSREKQIHAHRSGHCELCNLEEETTDHIIRCTNYQRLLARQEMLVSIIQYMQDLGPPNKVTTCASSHGSITT